MGTPSCSSRNGNRFRREKYKTASPPHTAPTTTTVTTPTIDPTTSVRLGPPSAAAAPTSAGAGVELFCPASDVSVAVVAREVELSRCACDVSVPVTVVGGEVESGVVTNDGKSVMADVGDVELGGAVVDCRDVDAPPLVPVAVVVRDEVFVTVSVTVSLGTTTMNTGKPRGYMSAARLAPAHWRLCPEVVLGAGPNNDVGAESAAALAPFGMASTSSGTLPLPNEAAN